MRAWLYTLPDCEACVEARKLVSAQGLTWIEVPIDNPLLEMGVGMLYKDKVIRAPVLVVSNKGIYILSTSEPRQFLRIVNLEPDLIDVGTNGAAQGM